MQVVIRVVAAKRIVRLVLLGLLPKFVSLELNTHFLAVRALLLDHDRNKVAWLGKLLQ